MSRHIKVSASFYLACACDACDAMAAWRCLRLPRVRARASVFVFASVRVCVHVCLCPFVRACARARSRCCTCARVPVRPSTCVHACACACVCARVHTIHACMRCVRVLRRAPCRTMQRHAQTHSAFAGLVAAVMSCPADVIKTRVMNQAFNHHAPTHTHARVHARMCAHAHTHTHRTQLSRCIKAPLTAYRRQCSRPLPPYPRARSLPCALPPLPC